MPVAHCVLCGGGQERMTGFNFCVRYAAVRLNSDQKDDCAANVHSAGEFGIDGRDAGDNSPLNGAGNCRSGAEEETSCKKKGTGRSE